MPVDPIVAGFERRLLEPEATLLISPRDRVTVGEIDRLARALQRRLGRRACGNGRILGLSAPNGSAFVAALMAIRRLGATVLLLDSKAPEAEKRRVCETLGAEFAVVSATGWPARAEDFLVEPVAAGRVSGDRAAGLPADAAVIKLTSGSSGLPRGIVTAASALVADDDALASTMGLRADERILAAVPMSHSYGLSSVVMPALMRRSVLIVPAEGNPLAPMGMARAHQATFLPTVPAYLHGLVKMTRPPAAPASLRRVISAGAPLAPDTARRFREIYGQPVHVFYGASECGGIAFDRVGDAGERGTLGTPVDGVRIELEPLSRRGFEPTAGADPEGAGGSAPRGTITVTSPAVATCTLPEASDELADGRFRTRDIATLVHGELRLQGRLDALINVRGKYVDPGEVDSVLAQLDGVDESVTLGVTRADQSEPIVRSIIACPDGRLTHEVVQRWCRRHLVGYKVPRSLIFLEQIPRTARGKIDRGALEALESEPEISRQADERHG